jgi:hypothetical protein
MTNFEMILTFSEGKSPIQPPTICHLIDDKIWKKGAATEQVALAGERA